MVRTADTRIRILREGENVQIEPYGKHVIRVRAAAGEIQDLDWTLLPPGEAKAEIRKEENDAVLVNGNILARVTEDGQISFWNQKGELLFAELWRNERDTAADRKSVV